MRRYLPWALWLIPLLLWFDTTVKPMAEPDLFFYYALIENYLRTGHWPTTDPFLYTLPGDMLMSLHQWLGYWIYYLPFQLIGWAGPILLKAILILLFLVLPLLPFWRAKKPLPDYFPLVWALAIFIAHHRFRERVSLFGDLFALALVSGLLRCSEKRWFWYALPALFWTWAQLHPSYPLGWVILFGFWICAGPAPREKYKLIATGLCLLGPLLGPLGSEGVIYPFRFSMEIEPYLRQYVVEWLPLTDPRLFQFRFLYLSFLTLIPFLTLRLWQERRKVAYFEWFILILGVTLSARSVRFGLMAQGFFLVLLTTVEMRAKRPAAKEGPSWLWLSGLTVLTLAVAVLKLSSSTTLTEPMTNRFRIDTSYFPEASTDFLIHLHPKLHIFNSFGFGGYLAWRWGGDPPLFFHGFSTNFKFYEENYNWPQENQANLDEEIRKFDIGIFFLSKLGNDDGFILLLDKHPGWQKIHEDGAAVIFAKRDARVFTP